MKKKTEKRGRRDELRREYDLSKLKGGVRGKYIARYRAGTNLVLLSPDVAEYFPDEQSVNTAPTHLDSCREAPSPRPALTTSSVWRRLALSLFALPRFAGRARHLSSCSGDFMSPHCLLQGISPGQHSSVFFSINSALFAENHPGGG
jgi:hypothetical protein